MKKINQTLINNQLKKKLSRKLNNHKYHLPSGKIITMQYETSVLQSKRRKIVFSSFAIRIKPIVNVYKLRFVLYNSYYGMCYTNKSWSNYRHRGQNGRHHNMRYIKRFNPDNVLPF